MLSALSSVSRDVKQYLLVTFNYWSFTLTDGALRMLVVLYFHQLGYDTLSIALLFIFYEVFGVITNLLGGWIGSRVGLNRTMNVGLLLQVGALLMLTLPTEYLTVVWVMIAQALSGIAKDLNKLSAKSSIKQLVKQGETGKLFKWIAVLTGSKNALKGVGFFLGGLLLTTVGFSQAMWLMSMWLFAVWLLSIWTLDKDLGKAKNKPKFSELFSKSPAINYLSAARMCLFGARDVWFVVALPVFLTAVLNWSSASVGIFMASWVIGYGLVQSLAPRLFLDVTGQLKHSRPALLAVLALTIVTLALTGVFQVVIGNGDLAIVNQVVVIGLLVFGAVFAVNSSLHSFLIVDLAKADGVAMDVGFYYMANAMGRLLGTILSGAVYQAYGLVECVAVSSLLLILATLVSTKLPGKESGKQSGKLPGQLSG
ncbi:organoarsenical effux MFS transporter ArsJ [Psychrosphaera ytuae]|uniref:Organoarsenical effux MFS transporter ArsJ n=1 Tax=Psychrosphaera ytuae TaxID=2820710 RepID=A0A975HIP2_9GAMM|nr:organoarsenical effux MFS transporter ArsJ [Psychrosphaera ytuae]QTH64471.1 organoarsenical effux MFS transporter ArsJ [Psychrosphaera ytuae]